MDERLGLGAAKRRPRAVDRLLQPACGQVGGEVGGDDEQEQRRAPPEEGDEERDREPDEPERASVRKPLEDGIEPAGPMVDDPALEPVVEPDQIGTSRVVDSISCSGSNGCIRRSSSHCPLGGARLLLLGLRSRAIPSGIYPDVPFPAPGARWSGRRGARHRHRLLLWRER